MLEDVGCQEMSRRDTPVGRFSWAASRHKVVTADSGEELCPLRQEGQE